MPKKSTKSRSGRKTLRHKHKVIKKVKEHHRKKAKEQKKLIKSWPEAQAAKGSRHPSRMALQGRADEGAGVQEAADSGQGTG